MNIRLTEVISDITGTSGLRMVEAIVAGERRPGALVGLCVPQLKEKKSGLILKALQGHYRDEHLFALKQALGTWKYYNGLILECDRQIEEQLHKITEGKEDTGTPAPERLSVTTGLPSRTFTNRC